MGVRRRSVLLFAIPLGLLAGSNDRDFSGNWTLDQAQSKLKDLPVTPGALLAVTQQGSLIQCSENGISWPIRLNGEESKYRIKDSSMNTETKWEGGALLVNTLVSGPQNYVVEDRWELSPDHTILTITRVVRRGGSASESTLIYRNEERLAALRKNAPPASGPTPREVPPAGSLPSDIVIKAGTKIPLELLNSLNTKHSAEGDRVYLETLYPITEGGKIVIPKGSYVIGTVTEVARAGKFKGKAEMFLRFDSLTLPNGVTRDFRSRLDNADGHDVDRQEGKIRGDSNKAGDARTVGEAAGAGAGIGAIAGRSAAGAGIGALGGAAAGLAGVMLSRGPDLVLPRGTTFEMVLDRDLHYQRTELVH